MLDLLVFFLISSPSHSKASRGHTNGFKSTKKRGLERDKSYTRFLTDCLCEPFSDFCTSGRIVGPHRSRLLPSTIEAIICSQNWLWAGKKGCVIDGDNVHSDEDDEGLEKNQRGRSELVFYICNFGFVVFCICHVGFVFVRLLDLSLLRPRSPSLRTTLDNASSSRPWATMSILNPCGVATTPLPDLPTCSAEPSSSYHGSGLRAGASGQDRPGLTEDQVQEMNHAEVISILRGQIPELFGSIKTVVMELFDDRYVALSEAASRHYCRDWRGESLPVLGLRQYETPSV
uniref:HAT C-terminal dimerisation domain-containing protein n=1 Tax=Lactuca sativa TaxID=4236 RepID=A0A9R1V766_LACSA|nr:hypothetical protein LSAT_V11C600339460 [Lactuca sativa]